MRTLFFVRESHLLVREGEDIVFPDESSLDELGPYASSAPFPGARGQVEYLCTEAASEVTAPPPGWRFLQLRSLLATVESRTASAAAQAAQLLSWRASNRFCGRCGATMADSAVETARLCPACSNLVYPRISPAIIVGVLRGGSLLLARNGRHRTPPMYSLIAGFVEPGECLEETVAREVREEVSIDVTNVTYFGSQPWPFPDSLMIGFLADHHSGEIEVDGEEIVEADWYEPSRFPTIPPHGSISRRIIEWYRAGGRRASAAPRGTAP